MPIFERGSLTFTKTRVSAASGPGHIIERWDCWPRPNGSVETLNPPATFAIELVPDFFQPRERAQTLEGARNPGEAAVTIEQLLRELCLGFRMTALTVEYALIPAEWRRVEPCFRTTISVSGYYVTYEIEARTKEKKELGGETFAAGDRVASFRIREPVSFQFCRRFEPQPKCCPEHAAAEGRAEWGPTKSKFPALELHPPIRLADPPLIEVRPLFPTEPQFPEPVMPGDAPPSDDDGHGSGQ